MIVAFWAAVGKVALKVLQFLVGDKKGRKFLGYVIGIVLFIVLIPVIAFYLWLVVECSFCELY